MKNQITIVVFLLLFAVVTSTSSVGDSTGKLTGTILDQSNDPIADARVSVCWVGPKTGYSIYCDTSYPDCKKKTITNQNGKFSLEGLDTTKKFRLAIVAPGYQAHLSEPVESGAESTVNLKAYEVPDADHFVLGNVVNEEGEPVVGAYVYARGAKTANRTWWGQIEHVDSVVTNSDGVFNLHVPEDYQALNVYVFAAGACPAQVEWLAKGEPQELVMPTGARVTGRLLHKQKPVKGLRLAVAQTDRSLGRNNVFVRAIGCVTDDQGRFQFNNLPPDQQYCIYSVVDPSTKIDAVMTTKTFSVPSSGETRDLGDLQTALPISIRGKVQRIDGKPLPTKFDLYFGRNPAWNTSRIKVAEDGTFEANGLPAETYNISLRNRDYEIVAKKMNYQVFDKRSFGVFASEAIDDLVIAIRKGAKDD